MWMVKMPTTDGALPSHLDLGIPYLTLGHNPIPFFLQRIEFKGGRLEEWTDNASRW